MVNKGLLRAGTCQAK
uniref:Uncharacterized protein n=1 Tax=Rhizophora mucronata TaxID=61149 RepID=A0A2P2LBX9_RHIMU